MTRDKPFNRSSSEFSNKLFDEFSDAESGNILDWARMARFYDDDYRYETEDVALVAELAGELAAEHGAQAGDGAHSMPLLDLGCGPGRALLPLALAGFPMTGVDSSPVLLERARTKLAAANVHAELVEADLTALELSHRDYAFAFCLSNTLMHLTTPAAQRALLERAHAHLRPGGLLLVDLFAPDVARLTACEGLLELADRWHSERDGAKVEVIKWSTRAVDWSTQLQETLFIYEEIDAEGNVHRTPCPFTLRFLWPHEGELMFEAAGFDIEALWGDWLRAPHDGTSERLIFLARKPH